jgi:hypothetical protein
MGVELVKQVAGHPSTSRLSGNAYKALVAMALQALDKPKDGRPASLYFGGWQTLMTALGYVPDGVDSAAHTAVKRAVKELKAGGHISPMLTAAKGTRQSYLIHPGGLGKGVDSDPRSPTDSGSPSDPKWGSPSDPIRGSDLTLNGGHSATHLGRTQEEEGLTQDRTPNRATSTTGSAGENKNAAEKKSGGVVGHAHVGGQDDDCQTCGLSKLSRVHAGYRPLRAV